jgi:predicted PurR-regulated permease PerM
MTRANWDQKTAIQKVKEEYEEREPALQASYDRLLSAIKEKIADIQKQGPKVRSIIRKYTNQHTSMILTSCIFSISLNAIILLLRRMMERSLPN